MTRFAALIGGLATGLVALAACTDPTPTVTDARFLALGDSYTVGEGVETDETWPVILARRLRADGREVGDPTVIAVTGWTTDELDAAVTAAEPGLVPPYRLVTLLVGVNDQYRGRTADAFRVPFRALVDRAVGFAGGQAGRVVVVSIPDWGVTPFAEGRDRAVIGREIDAFNAVARAEAARAGARWVDITEATRRDPSAVVADGLHPSGAVYWNWADAIAPHARAALAE